MDSVILEFFRGDTYMQTVEISNLSEKIEKIFFTVKDKEYSDDYLFQKKLGDGISLINDSDNVKTYSLVIEPSDTDALEGNRLYPFDIEIITDNIKNIIVKGNIKLKTDITRPKDEL